MKRVSKVLRYSEELHQAIKTRAEKNGRSATKEIEHILQNVVFEYRIAEEFDHSGLIIRYRVRGSNNNYIGEDHLSVENALEELNGLNK